MDPAYQWDLSSLYTDDAAWETALQGLDECITKTAAFEGTLTTAEAIRAYFDASTELGGQLFFRMRLCGRVRTRGRRRHRVCTAARMRSMCRRRLR